MSPKKQKVLNEKGTENSLINKNEWLSGSEMAAELGVSASRLGNWRSRYADFPPTTKSESGLTLYKREEMHAWKIKRFPDDSSVYESRLDTVWKFSDAIRSSQDVEALAPLALAMLCLAKIGISPVQFRESENILDSSQRHVEEVLRDLLMGEKFDQGRQDLLWDILEDAQGTEINKLLEVLDTISQKRGYWSQPTSPDPLNDLIAKLIHHRQTDVFDPVSGEGRTLIRAAEVVQGTAVGQDINERVSKIAIMRAFLMDIKADIHVVDTLKIPQTSKCYKVVVADPPMGMKYPADGPTFVGPFGSSRMVADWAWVQIVAMNLTKDGEGYVNVISGALFHRMSIEVRREMIRRGCIEAVIALPPLSSSARVSSALLCLRAADSLVGEDVLMIDASDLISRESDEFNSKIPQIVKLVESFRNDRNSINNEVHATVVSVLDLLQGDCSLAPTQHIAKARKSKGEIVGQLSPLLEEVGEAIQKISRFKSSPFQSGSFPISHTVLRELRLSDKAIVIQGVRTEDALIKIESNDQIPPVGSQSVLTVKALRIPGPLISRDYIFRERETTRAVTQPGDIVIARMGDSLAKVDAKGGNLVLSPLSIIRLDLSFDPYVVASALNSGHVRKMTMSSSGVGRIDLDAVEIPQTSLENALILRSVIKELEELEGNIEELRSKLIRFRDEAGDFLATATQVTL